MKLRKQPLVFWLAQCLLLLVAGGWIFRHVPDEMPNDLPFSLRAEPLRIGPLYDEPAVISDQQLRRVIGRLRLPDRGATLSINHVDHALRLWGVGRVPPFHHAFSASQKNRQDNRDGVLSGDRVLEGQSVTFAESASDDWLSGDAMRQLLLDHRVFRQRYSDRTAPLLLEEPGGWLGVRVQQGPTSSSHYDHTVACLAEVGTPGDFPVIAPRQTTTFARLVESALYRFQLNQVEYEWSALLAALYLPPVKGWQTAEGQYVSFDHLARRIVREPLSRGVCAANHRIHALVVLLRIDQQHPILEPATRDAVMAFLADVTARLVASQHAEGYWELTWYRGTRRDDDVHTSGTALGDRILATGHPLEWWALAPREVLPPRSTLVEAAQWLYRTIDGLSPEEVERYYTYLTHAGRALLLWRGADCWSSFVARKPSNETVPTSFSSADHPGQNFSGQ